MLSLPQTIDRKAEIFHKLLKQNEKVPKNEKRCALHNEKHSESLPRKLFHKFQTSKTLQKLSCIRWDLFLLFFF